MIALVATAAGDFAVDVDTEELEPWAGGVDPAPAPELSLPRIVSFGGGASHRKSSANDEPATKPLVLQRPGAGG